MTPEAPVAGMGAPAAVVSTTPAIWIGMELLEGLEEILTVATATIPAGIKLSLSPETIHVVPAQLMVLPALVAEAPAATVTLTMSCEYANDH